MEAWAEAECCLWVSLPLVYSTASTKIRRRKLVRGRGQGKLVSETMSSGQDRNDVLMNSQQLWLLSQDLHKIWPANTPIWVRIGHTSSYSYLRNNWWSLLDAMERISFLGVVSFMRQHKRDRRQNKRQELDLQQTGLCLLVHTSRWQILTLVSWIVCLRKKIWLPSFMGEWGEK